MSDNLIVDVRKWKLLEIYGHGTDGNIWTRKQFTFSDRKSDISICSTLLSLYHSKGDIVVVFPFGY